MRPVGQTEIGRHLRRTRRIPGAPREAGDVRAADTPGRDPAGFEWQYADTKMRIRVIPAEQRSLKSSNPILSCPQFSRRGGQKTAVRDPRSGIAAPRSRIGAGQDLAPGGEHRPGDFAQESAQLRVLVGDLMTTGDVLSRSAAALGVTGLTAALSWTLLPRTSLSTAACYGIAGAAGMAAAALVGIQRRRNLPSPTLTLAFAAVQGVFLAVLSTTVSTHLSPGVFVQLVLATMATSAGALLARSLRWMGVSHRPRGLVGTALLGTALLVLADWILYLLTGADVPGLRPLGLAVFMSVIGVVLATAFLDLHFRQIENGIAQGASGEQSWTAAFGLTLTLTWLYVETVRLSTLVPAEDLY
ncbi:Bax inhibitor-1/YccA family membrane protein [Actinacidiphila glaucinigra]|uniref:Bax inhibitor-1/YccA family membrane protein n=1 Tax=Actinacidiphila glaucinigra TaxID=235986 RepID=UPI003672B3C7